MQGSVSSAYDHLSYHLRRKICKNYYEKKERGVTAGQAL
jgi:hypothetical protein